MPDRCMMMDSGASFISFYFFLSGIRLLPKTLELLIFVSRQIRLRYIKLLLRISITNENPPYERPYAISQKKVYLSHYYKFFKNIGILLSFLFHKRCSHFSFVSCYVWKRTGILMFRWWLWWTKPLCRQISNSRQEKYSSRNWTSVGKKNESRKRNFKNKRIKKKETFYK